MRFGGHESFPIREGWLHKGLALLVDAPDKLVDVYAADYLGVGGNMAKSIRHWLVAAGLAEPSSAKPAKGQKSVPLRPTDLGRLVHAHDPYFSESGTWWILHVNLARSSQHAVTWSWFFNHFAQPRFDKAVCLEHLRRYLQFTLSRLPSARTLSGDVDCFLATYARTIPPRNEDPEEARDCPFVELGLLDHFRDTGTYQLNLAPKEIPAQVLGYAMSRAFGEGQAGAKTIDVTIQEAAVKAGGPGKVFALPAESLYDVAARAEYESRGKRIQIVGMAGDRTIRLKHQEPLAWIEQFYAALPKPETAWAATA